MGSDFLKASAYCGDFQVEDDAFECRAERLIVFLKEIRFQFSCFDSVGGLHTAEGVAVEVDEKTWRTTELRVRYVSDKKDVPARFTIKSIHPSPSKDVLHIEAEWSQAGDVFWMNGALEPFKVRNKGDGNKGGMAN